MSRKRYEIGFVAALFCVDIRPMFSAMAQGRYLLESSGARGYHRECTESGAQTDWIQPLTMPPLDAGSFLEMKTLVAVPWSSLEVEVVLVLVHLQVQSRFVQLEEEHLELVHVVEAGKFLLRPTPQAQSGLPVCLPTPR